VNHEELGDLGLTNAEVDTIVAFLETLTDGYIPPTYLIASSNIPTDFTLGQNYPNPFNPMTHFSLNLALRTHVSLTIFNIIGQRVKTLGDDYMDAGVHTFTWDGTNEKGEAVSSGVYLYRVVTEGNVVTKKMILMK
jgi:hypothetical protein